MFSLFHQISAKSVMNIQAKIPLVTAFRGALYPAWHLTPTPDKNKIAQLEAEGKLEALTVIPVKPAPSDMSSSVYQDPMVKKFTNMVMSWSEKALARELMHGIFTRIKRIQLSKYHAAVGEEKATIVCDPKKIFIQAVKNCQPVLMLVPVKKGGITYQVPVPVTPNKSLFMAMKWLINAGLDKEGQISFVEQMSKELLDAYHNVGRVIKRKQDLHKVCENNKAYAHYRWS